MQLVLVEMYQLTKMPFIKFLLNILKLNIPIYDWFCPDGSHIIRICTCKHQNNAEKTFIEGTITEK